MSTNDTAKTNEAKPVRQPVILQVVTWAKGITDEIRRRHGDEPRETVSCKNEDVSGTQIIGLHKVLIDLSELARDLDTLHYTGSGLAMGGRHGNKPIVTFGFTNVLSDEDVVVNMREEESVPVNAQFESLYDQSWVATAAFVWDNPEGRPDAIICDGMTLYKNDPGTAVLRLRYVAGETYVESQVHFQGTGKDRQVRWNKGKDWARVEPRVEPHKKGEKVLSVSKHAMLLHSAMNKQLSDERKRSGASAHRW